VDPSEVTKGVPLAGSKLEEEERARRTEERWARRQKERFEREQLKRQQRKRQARNTNLYISL
jgi:hypothetical protein